MAVNYITTRLQSFLPLCFTALLLAEPGYGQTNSGQYPSVKTVAPVTVQDHIYSASGDKIVVLDSKTGQKADIIKTGMRSENGYELKGTIINLLDDKVNNRLYFSNKDVYPGTNRPEYLTWYYDLNTGKVKVFCDGRIVGITSDGNAEVYFDDSDDKGHYIAKVLFSADRKILSRSENDYTK